MTFAFELEETRAGGVRMAVLIDDEVVWPHPEQDDGASEFDPEDVLSYLADAWASLLLAQSWPVAFEPDDEPRSVTGLLRAAEERWERLGDDSPDAGREAALLDEFLYQHDFSQMKHGAGLKPCFVLRQIDRVRLEANGQVHEDIAFGQFVAELNRLGALAAESLKRRNDDTARRAIDRWERRDRIDPLATAALISGIPREEVERTHGLGTMLTEAVANRSLSDVANDNTNPILAAARSSGPLGPASLVEVLREIRSIPDGNATGLAKLRINIRRALRGIDRPLDQGIRAADYVRGWLDQSADQAVDLQALSERLGIFVRRQTIPDRRLDGIASAGPSHGPAILLNLNTRRQGAGADDLERSLRFTWSHEIGHLLLDESEWPALVDAVRQRVARTVETRANAFAAYLLLPQAVACRWWEQQGSPTGWGKLEALLNDLTGTFGIPRIVASRQLARGVPQERRRSLEQVFETHIPNFQGPDR
ncbi:Zn-dependent peptidase ImmA, M78 family [Enhydrobacter aerosaccus]|uniref:Zn-dependent peptidase ImmA, M78 family n=1 Tax=Enhydrobacter aerosaccus TaxID=225324 RepID=A0A1T4SQ00_9HYPH|nr:ImmA/IrrE family metallo-endopeptidase [Enhydrobacter aerosaccus]SKA30319.1 Zn-dependent peptidase ImmA, M78 family [Enhydrobacter aerosaccus]